MTQNLTGVIPTGEERAAHLREEEEEEEEEEVQSTHMLPDSHLQSNQLLNQY